MLVKTTSLVRQQAGNSPDRWHTYPTPHEDDHEEDVNDDHHNHDVDDSFSSWR